MNRSIGAALTVVVFMFAATFSRAETVTVQPVATTEKQAAPCAKDAETTPSTERRVLAMSAAVVPGLVITGTGHWVNGQPCIARKLVVAEAVGLTGMGIGLPTLALTGGSQYLATPAILLTMGGFGIVLATIGANIYGVSGAARHAGEPFVRRPTWETEHGIMRVYNPSFEFKWLVTQRATLNLDRVSISGALDTALEGAHADYRLGTSLRLVGARPTVSARDGTHLDLRAEIAEQRFTRMGFVTDSAEIQIAGRVDLGRYGPTLRGSFAEMSTGLLRSRTSYRIDRYAVKPDYGNMLLGRIAFGVYLGREHHRGSEAMFYYDHRRDDYAAGIKLMGYGNGMVGHVGLTGRYFFSERLGVHSYFETGSAHVFSLSLVFRAGEKP